MLEEIFRHTLDELIPLPMLCQSYEDKFISKWKQGVSLYAKPKKNLCGEKHKRINAHRFLCTAAYR